jgi:hypothetical protein
MTASEKELSMLMRSSAHSEAIKAGISQSMQAGKVKLNCSQFLGYTKGADGNLVIAPEEAEVVRKIFELYLQGNGCRKIKRYLEEHDIKTVNGKSEWSTSTIDRMLSNDKYIGDLLLQKTFTAGARGHQVQRSAGHVLHRKIITSQSSTRKLGFRCKS